MAHTVLSLAEWLFKQQQQLQQQLGKLAEKQQPPFEQQQEIEQLKEALVKLKNRDSSNRNIPRLADQLLKPRDKRRRKKGFKRGPKYDHPGKTRNGSAQADQIPELERETCRMSQAAVEPVTARALQVQQVAELVDLPVEIRE
jgi:DNA-binding protein H-NS